MKLIVTLFAALALVASAHGDALAAPSSDTQARSAQAKTKAAKAPAPAAPLLEVDGPDPMYDNAVAVVLKHGKASISLVQRHLRIGYNHAARLLEAMEKAGVVSHMSDLGQRTVLKGGAA